VLRSHYKKKKTENVSSNHTNSNFISYKQVDFNSWASKNALSRQRLELKCLQRLREHETCPSDRNPATSMTVLNSLGSNSGLFTPTFAASATPIPTKFETLSFNSTTAALKRKKRGSDNYLRIITQVRVPQREQNEEAWSATGCVLEMKGHDTTAS